MTSTVEYRSYDVDDCIGHHRFDENCNWRSDNERTVFPLVVAAVHLELGVACEHYNGRGTCGDAAIAALDALYENGYAVARS